MNIRGIFWVKVVTNDVKLFWYYLILFLSITLFVNRYLSEKAKRWHIIHILERKISANTRMRLLIICRCKEIRKCLIRVNGNLRKNRENECTENPQCGLSAVVVNKNKAEHVDKTITIDRGINIAKLWGNLQVIHAVYSNIWAEYPLRIKQWMYFTEEILMLNAVGKIKRNTHKFRCTINNYVNVLLYCFKAVLPLIIS